MSIWLKYYGYIKLPKAEIYISGGDGLWFPSFPLQTLIKIKTRFGDWRSNLSSGGQLHQYVMFSWNNGIWRFLTPNRRRFFTQWRRHVQVFQKHSDKHNDDINVGHVIWMVAGSTDVKALNKRNILYALGTPSRSYIL